MRCVPCAGLVTLVLLGGCGRKADVVIQGGPVWTGLSTGRGQPGAVAIADGKILAVGDSAAIGRYVGSRTEVLHAAGGLVMPGFADGHTHFIDGGFQLASVNLRDAATPQEFVRRIKEYADHFKNATFTPASSNGENPMWAIPADCAFPSDVGKTVMICA